MNNGPTIRNGSTGNDVRRLQRVLVMIKSLGFTEIDGVFGAKTEAAVKDFQSGNGLTADGIVGPQTWHARTCRRAESTSGSSGSANAFARRAGTRVWS